MAFLAVGFTGILVLISKVLFGAVASVVTGLIAAAVLGGLWFALPLSRRRRVAQSDSRAGEGTRFRPTRSG